MRLPASPAVVLIALVLLTGCSPSAKPRLVPFATGGPAADYPVIVGDPFTIGNVTYTPVDKLNVDEVGTAIVAEGIDGGVTAAHKTLPLPSYVEVTSLETGRTILVRVNERGPMRNDALLQLSPAASAQLGIVRATPVRVRRVNPPETERSLLRAGGQAPERMTTPRPLVDALKRKLNPSLPTGAPAIRPIEPAATAFDPVPAPIPKQAPEQVPGTAAAPAKPASPALAKGALVIQLAAFSTSERANAAAKAISGSFVVKPARYWLLRTGPFATASQASAALAKVRVAGYSDARIQRAE